MNIKLADGLPYHPTKRHPRTGNRLRAIGILNGKPVWPIMGASDDDEGEDKGDKPDGDDKTDKDGDKGEKKPEETAEQKRIRELEAEIEKVKSHRSAADKGKAALEKELQELKDKDLSDLEKTKKDLAKALEDGAKSGKAFQNLARTNAFLESSQKLKIQWHDPAVARAAAQDELNALDISDDGKIDGVDAILKKLAKDKPFLVDTGKKAEDEKDSKDDKKGPSGTGVGSGNKSGGKGKEELSKEDLHQRFPALRK